MVSYKVSSEINAQVFLSDFGENSHRQNPEQSTDKYSTHNAHTYFLWDLLLHAHQQELYQISLIIYSIFITLPNNLRQLPFYRVHHHLWSGRVCTLTPNIRIGPIPRQRIPIVPNTLTKTTIPECHSQPNQTIKSVFTYIVVGTSLFLIITVTASVNAYSHILLIIFQRPSYLLLSKINFAVSPEINSNQSMLVQNRSTR